MDFEVHWARPVSYHMVFMCAGRQVNTVCTPREKVNCRCAMQGKVAGIYHALQTWFAPPKEKYYFQFVTAMALQDGLQSTQVYK